MSGPRCRARAGRRGPSRSGWRRGRGWRRARTPRVYRVARARVTASLTQSRIGASLVWQARQMSPGSTACSISVVPAGVDDPHRAGGGDLEGLVVRAVLLGCLGHQPDVGHRAHRGGVEGAVRAAVVDARSGRPRRRSESGITARASCSSPSGPHMWPRGADHRRHRGVDDDVAGHVQVGDAAVVDHRQRGAVGVDPLDRRLDGLLLGGRRSRRAARPGRRWRRCRRRRAPRRTARRPWGRTPAPRGRR